MVCTNDRYIDEMFPLRVSEALPELTGRRKGFEWLYRAGTIPIRYLLVLVGALVGLISRFSTYSYIGLYLVIFGGTLDPMKRERWKHFTLQFMLGFILATILILLGIPWYYGIFICLIVRLISSFGLWLNRRRKRRNVNSRLDAMTGYNSS